MLHKMRLSPYRYFCPSISGSKRRRLCYGIALGCRTCVALTHVPHYCSGGYDIALGCRTCVALTRVPDYYSAGFDVRLHFHASPSLGSSYVYGTGNGTLAVKGRGCHGGIALAHQPWSVPFMGRYPCQSSRKVSYAMELLWVVVLVLV